MYVCMYMYRTELHWRKSNRRELWPRLTILSCRICVSLACICIIYTLIMSMPTHTHTHTHTRTHRASPIAPVSTPRCAYSPRTTDYAQSLALWYLTSQQYEKVLRWFHCFATRVRVVAPDLSAYFPRLGSWCEYVYVSLLIKYVYVCMHVACFHVLDPDVNVCMYHY